MHLLLAQNVSPRQMTTCARKEKNLSIGMSSRYSIQILYVYVNKIYYMSFVLCLIYPIYGMEEPIEAVDRTLDARPVYVFLYVSNSFERARLFMISIRVSYRASRKCKRFIEES
jgi:hypothetical protein